MDYTIATPDDLPAILELLAESYRMDSALLADDLRHFGVSGFRLLRSNAAIDATLEVVPIGQWFGGRRVPMWGVASVATRSERRGTGAATRLLTAALQEMRRGGAAVSTLIPSTTGLYRKVGYERAGALVRYDLPLALIGPLRRDGEVIRCESPDRDALEAVYETCARANNGMLARDASFWQYRCDLVKGPALTTYLVRFAGRTEGYAILAREYEPERITLRDVQFTTRRAGEQLITFLADHRAQYATARWWGGPCDPLAQLLAEQQAAATPCKEWMLRIVDLPAALVARGYAAGVSGTLHLDVADPLLADNAGRWVLDVHNGRAQVTRGGEGRLHVGIRGLAALYTGHISPSLLCLLELAAGPADDLALAGAMFAGPAPFMVDAF